MVRKRIRDFAAKFAAALRAERRAVFRISRTYTIESRQLFVLAGSKVRGKIAPGMVVLVPLNRSMSISAPVSAIEYVRLDDGSEEMCLCVHYLDEDELELWRTLNIGNETVEVAPAVATAGAM